MRADLSRHTLRAPADLSEALRLLAEEPGWTPIAGGTDLMVLFNAGRLQAPRLLDLSRLYELKGVSEDGTHLTLGALTTYTELLEQRSIHQFFPNLARSARATGARAIQNRGTLGGNIVNGSPAADTPPALLAYGAELELISARGARWVPYHAFHLVYKRMDLAPDELVARVRLPKPQGLGYHFYRKVGTRQAQAIAKVGLAAYARLDDRVVVEFRVGLASVAPAPVRASRVEAIVLGRSLDDLSSEEAKRALQEDIAPIDDLRASAHFRRVVAGNLLGRMLEELARVRG